MLEDRIIVQDRGGIDAGLAALMQNANKGNMDPEEVHNSRGQIHYY